MGNFAEAYSKACNQADCCCDCQGIPAQIVVTVSLAFINSLLDQCEAFQIAGIADDLAATGFPFENRYCMAERLRAIQVEQERRLEQLGAD